MILGVLKEPLPEKRVSLHPEAVKALVSAGNKVMVEPGAGSSAFLSDELYQEAGAEIKDRQSVLEKAEILFQISPLEKSEWSKLVPGTSMVEVYQPLVAVDIMKHITSHGLTLCSMGCMPRITRAQCMDVLSSMSTVSGYKAVLLAAANLPRFFPMLMT